jgi:hypothetical protein
MKSPKGFGKVYFTFASILAHSISNNIQSNTTKTQKLIKNDLFQEEIEDDNPPLEPLLLCEENNKPCHCNYFYKLETALMLKINHFIPRCPYYTTYFAFRRTGVHPPYFIH